MKNKLNQRYGTFFDRTAQLSIFGIRWLLILRIVFYTQKSGCRTNKLQPQQQTEIKTLIESINTELPSMICN